MVLMSYLSPACKRLTVSDKDSILSESGGGVRVTGEQNKLVRGQWGWS